MGVDERMSDELLLTRKERGEVIFAWRKVEAIKRDNLLLVEMVCEAQLAKGKQHYPDMEEAEKRVKLVEDMLGIHLGETTLEARVEEAKCEETKRIIDWLDELLKENQNAMIPRTLKGMKCYFIQDAGDWLCARRIREFLEDGP